MIGKVLFTVLCRREQEVFLKLAAEIKRIITNQFSDVLNG